MSLLPVTCSDDSGDDHDYCEHTHPKGIREITIKSFSSSAGIRRPGFQLLSLTPPSASSQLTYADRPCSLPDQLGVYHRVYLPLAIITILYLFTTNIRSAWLRWNSGPTHGEVKNRLSPILPSIDTSGPSSARRLFDRPLPPSRKSSHNLGLGVSPMTPTGRPARLGPEHLTPKSSRSAPVSPQHSPRQTQDPWTTALSRNDEDMEAGESVYHTPRISRRSSYNLTSANVDEPPSYFISSPSTTGLGLSGDSFPARSPLEITSGQPRRVTMPRMMSASDWSAAAKAKDKSVLGLMVDSLPVPGAMRSRDRKTAGMETLRGFARWLWKARNGVVVRSWREAVAIAWPSAVVWLVVNGLFVL